MNILFCCPSRFNLNSKIINSLGGIENLNLELSKNLSSNKYKIYLSTLCKKIIKKKNFINLPISTIKKNNNKYNFDYVISSNEPNIFKYFKNSKKILWMHNTLAVEKAIRKKKIFSILTNKINAVFVSEYLNKNTSKLYNFKNRFVIPNFLDRRFENQKIQFKRKPWIIWAVSREKGLKEIINLWKEIFKLNRNTQFHIFGIKKKNKVKKLKKYNIFFHNRVSKKILIRYYKKSIASLCLGYDETFCLNAIESMSCGVPVIGFKKTAINNLIKNNINGYKVDNFKKIYEKINFIINMSNQKRSILINNTYSYSKKYYFYKIKKKWIQLIRK